MYFHCQNSFYLNTTTMSLEDLKNKLQIEINKSPTKGLPRVSIGSFNNWAQTRYTQQLLVVEPASPQEIQSVVNGARTLGLKIRCQGYGHSWSDLFPDPGNILMKIGDKLMRDVTNPDNRRIELKREDEDNPDQVTSVIVSAGVSLGELKDKESTGGFNMMVNVIVPNPTYGGVVNGGCHGVGWNLPAIVDYCKTIKAVNSSGEFVEYHSSDDDGENNIFKAAQTSFGLFGIVYELEMIVEPTIEVLVQNDFSKTVEDTFDENSLQQLVCTHDSVEIFWFPFNSLKMLADAFTIGWDWLWGHKIPSSWKAAEDKTWIRKINFLNSDKTNNDHKTIPKGAINDALIDLIGEVARRTAHYPIAGAVHYWGKSLELLCKREEKTDLVNAVHYLTVLDYNIPVHDMEWCFDVDPKDFGPVVEAIQHVIDLVTEYKNKEQYPLNMVMEMRFCKTSQAYMCPQIIGNLDHIENGVAGHGHTFYLEVLSAVEVLKGDGERKPTEAQKERERLWKEFCNKVMEGWINIEGIKKPRVHLAKEWGFLDGIDNYIAETRKDEIDKFMTYRQQVGCDPDRMFTNAKLEKIFNFDKYDDDGDLAGPQRKRRKTKR